MTSTASTAATVTLNAPTIPQTDAAVLGADLAVTATANPDLTYTITIDAGTIGALCNALAAAALEDDARYRRAQAATPAGDRGAYAGSTATRLRTVVDAVRAAGLIRQGPTSTYDLD